MTAGRMLLGLVHMKLEVEHQLSLEVGISLGEWVAFQMWELGSSPSDGLTWLNHQKNPHATMRV